MSLKVGYSQRTAFFFHLPAIIILSLITMVPLAYNIRMSFFNFSLSIPGSRNVFIGLQNYIDIITDQEYWNAMWVTVRFVLASTLMQLFFGIIIALLLHYFTGKGGKVLTSIVMIPMMVAPLVVGLMFSFILNPQFGLYSYLLDIFKLNFFQNPFELWRECFIYPYHDGCLGVDTIYGFNDSGCS